MKRLKRFFLWFNLVGFLLLILILWGSRSMEKRDDFSDFKIAFQQKKLPIVEYRYTLDDGEMYYVRIGDKSLPVLLLIHGSPGDWTAWKDLILTTDLAQHYQLIIPDRPGYQSSTTMGGGLAIQSSALAPLMEQHCQPCIVAGHSFGGALALQLAVDYPENVAAVVSLAGTIAAPFQAPKWYNDWAEHQWLQQFLTEGFLASNREMMLLSKDLYALTAKLKGLDLPIYLLQGGKDILVNPGSPFYLLGQFNRVNLRFNSQWDHFIIWTEMEEVTSFIQRVNP